MISTTIEIKKKSYNELKHKDVLFTEVTWWLFGVLPLYRDTRFMCFEDQISSQSLEGKK